MTYDLCGARCAHPDHYSRPAASRAQRVRRLTSSTRPPNKVFRWRVELNQMITRSNFSIIFPSNPTMLLDRTFPDIMGNSVRPHQPSYNIQTTDPNQKVGLDPWRYY